MTGVCQSLSVWRLIEQDTRSLGSRGECRRVRWPQGPRHNKNHVVRTCCQNFHFAGTTVGAGSPAQHQSSNRKSISVWVTSSIIPHEFLWVSSLQTAISYLHTVSDWRRSVWGALRLCWWRYMSRGDHALQRTPCRNRSDSAVQHQDSVNKLFRPKTGVALNVTLLVCYQWRHTDTKAWLKSQVAPDLHLDSSCLLQKHKLHRNVCWSLPLCCPVIRDALVLYRCWSTNPRRFLTNVRRTWLFTSLFVYLVSCLMPRPISKDWFCSEPLFRQWFQEWPHRPVWSHACAYKGKRNEDLESDLTAWGFDEWWIVWWHRSQTTEHLKQQNVFWLEWITSVLVNTDRKYAKRCELFCVLCIFSHPRLHSNRLRWRTKIWDVFTYTSLLNEPNAVNNDGTSDATQLLTSTDAKNLPWTQRQNSVSRFAKPFQSFCTQSLPKRTTNQTFTQGGSKRVKIRGPLEKHAGGSWIPTLPVCLCRLRFFCEFWLWGALGPPLYEYTGSSIWKTPLQCYLQRFWRKAKCCITNSAPLETDRNPNRSAALNKSWPSKAHSRWRRHALDPELAYRLMLRQLVPLLEKRDAQSHTHLDLPWFSGLCYTNPSSDAPLSKGGSCSAKTKQRPQTCIGTERVRHQWWTHPYWTFKTCATSTVHVRTRCFRRRHLFDLTLADSNDDEDGFSGAARGWGCHDW